MNKTIEILASQTQTQVLRADIDMECMLCESHFDSIKEAKTRLKYLVSEDYRRNAEFTNPIRYAQIKVDGECVYDWFAKGYNGEDSDHEA